MLQTAEGRVLYSGAWNDRVPADLAALLAEGHSASAR